LPYINRAINRWTGEKEGVINSTPGTTTNHCVNNLIAIAARFKANELNSVVTRSEEAFRKSEHTIVLISTPVFVPPVIIIVGRNNMDKYSINNHTTTISPVKANSE